MSRSSKEEVDAELSDLWRRRFDLPMSDLTRLCRLASEVLLPSGRPPELARLPGEHMDYVNDFIADKVLRPGGKGDYLHAGGLRVMYRNYLKDLIDRQETWTKYHVSATVDEDDDPTGPCSSVDSYPQEPCGAHLPNETEHAMLRDHHLTVEAVCMAAKTWLSGSERWVPVYLAHNFCADKEVREPLVHLAKRYGIASYHHKAEKLGINWDGEKARRNGENFSGTLIGKWLTEDLGIPIDDNNIRVIKIAFDLLCFEALNWGEKQEIAK